VAVEEGWQRRHPHVQLDRAAMRSLLGVAVLESEVVGGGLRNTNCKLRLAGNEPPVVLRLYAAEAVACAREVALIGLVGARVPVPGSCAPTPRPTHPAHSSSGLTACVSTRCFPPGWRTEHQAPRRQFLVFLSGTAAIETSDGETRYFQAGDVLLAEDTTGKGHASKNNGEDTLLAVVIQLHD
jgi:hypothetical protein